MRNCRVAAVEHAGEVGVDDTPPVFVRLSGDVDEYANAGVVDEDIETAESVDRLVDKRSDGGSIANVRGDRMHGCTARRNRRKPLLSVTEMFGIDAGDGDVDAVRQKR
jgi:hypothetical protein